VFSDRETESEHAAPLERDDFRGTSRMYLPHQETRLGNHRFARPKRRRTVVEQMHRSLMVRIVSRQQGDERTRIEQDPGPSHVPKPSRCFLAVERSRGPFLNLPALGPASVRALGRLPAASATRYSP
jgi:hypothetical protein